MRKRKKKVDKALEAPPHSFTLGLWMEKLQISDMQLADKLGTGRIAVWKWRVGDRQPRPNMIPRIAKALGIEPADLYRQPGRLISLDAAAEHITNNDVRQSLAKIIKGYPSS